MTAPSTQKTAVNEPPIRGIDFLPLYEAARGDVERRKAAEGFYEAAAARYAPASVKNLVTAIRKALRDAGHDDEIFASNAKGGVVPDSLYEGLNTAKIEELWERHNNLRPLDPDEYLQQINRFIHAYRTSPKPNALDLALYIIGVTGRRPAEILLTGEFFEPGKPGETFGRKSVMFAGQTKTRGADGTQQDAYRIPTLIKGKDVAALLDELRAAMLHDYGDAFPSDTQEVNRRFSSSMGMRCKRTFQSLEWTPKTMRAAYAAITYSMHGHPTRQSPVAFYSKVLGHRNLGKDKDAGDLETPLSYFLFQIKDGWRPNLSRYIPDEE